MGKDLNDLSSREEHAINAHVGTRFVYDSRSATRASPRFNWAGCRPGIPYVDSRLFVKALQLNARDDDPSVARS
jgi:hypothetical protein